MQFSSSCLEFNYDPETGVCYRKLGSLGFPWYRVGTDGSVWSKHGGNWKRLKQYTNHCEYLAIMLWTEDKQKYIFAHRLVLIAFSGPRPDGMESRHLDGNRQNNSVENLAWGDKREQWQDRRRHGYSHCGTGNPNSKLSDDTVREIRRLHSAGDCTKVALGLCTYLDACTFIRVTAHKFGFAIFLRMKWNRPR